MQSNVIPLPHQIHALSLAITDDRARYLIADEGGGSARPSRQGWIVRELARRILFVSQEGIGTQWMAKIQSYFNEKFQLVLSDECQR